MEKLTRAETWEALEHLTRIYFVQATMLFKEGIFEAPREPMVFGESNGPDFDMRVVFAPKSQEFRNDGDDMGGFA